MWSSGAPCHLHRYLTSVRSFSQCRTVLSAKINNEKDRASDTDDETTSNKQKQDEKDSDSNKIDINAMNQPTVRCETAQTSTKDKFKHSLVKTELPILLPRVRNTDDIGDRELQTEGLFAGYKPLFLGNSMNNLEVVKPFNDLITTLRKISVVGKDSKNGSDTTDAVSENKESTSVYLKQSSADGSIIPWDASISGMVYNDEPFKDVPRTIVSKLKPFKLMKITPKSSRVKKKDDAIKARFHNSKIDDKAELVDLRRRVPLKHQKAFSSLTHSDSARQKYQQANTDASKFRFIKADRHVFKSDVERLGRFLAKEFQKLTDLSIRYDLHDYHIPLYIYVNKSITSRITFKRALRKRVVDHIDPMLATILSNYENSEHAENFANRVKIKTDSIVNEISDYLPSVYFTGESIDCIIHPSPIKNFGRLHWLKPTKRHNIFRGRNIDNDFVFSINNDYKLTRSRMRYVPFPVNLHWKTFSGAFEEWEHIA
ncbi:LAMI_0C07844g1_1 [Lachancea mirantina]|uniref:LAMI_0C07844g1_1 n=1 Tax=Lachancea mirantina TaxID=1230905 RepID=A0A1G4J4S2_9SACH|nr:LAMI_0C07844g1_1 [Lachancea mirantina]